MCSWCMYMLMRDGEGRKKEASKVKQTRQSNTAPPRQSLFLEKMSCLRWDSSPYSRQSALPTELPRQLSWLGPNLTSHSTPDEQANHQYMYMLMRDGEGRKKQAHTNMYMYIHMYMWREFESQLIFPLEK